MATINYVNIVTNEPTTESQRRHGYPATHVIVGGGKGPLCGTHLRHFWVNDYSGQSTNCKRCLAKLDKDAAPSAADGEVTE